MLQVYSVTSSTSSLLYITSADILLLPACCILLAASYKAVQWTLQNLYREGDVLHLLHVVPSSSNTHVTGGFGLGATLPPEEGLQVRLYECLSIVVRLQMFCWVPCKQP